MNQEVLNLAMKFVDFIQDVSPQVWEVLVRQQYVEALCVIIPLSIILPVFVYIIFSILTKKKWTYNNYGLTEGCFVSLVFSIVTSGILLFAFFGGALPRLLNPMYYAIMTLKP